MSRKFRTFTRHTDACNNGTGICGFDNPNDTEKCYTYHEYMMDRIVAKRVYHLRCGKHGNNIHSWRAVAIAITGIECQYTGKELCRIAEWTLGMPEGALEDEHDSLFNP